MENHPVVCTASVSLLPTHYLGPVAEGWGAPQQTKEGYSLCVKNSGRLPKLHISFLTRASTRTILRIILATTTAADKRLPAEEATDPHVVLVVLLLLSPTLMLLKYSGASLACCSSFCFPGVCRFRYAAEALHRSEEVRLLTAKLGAADGKAQAKLAQVPYGVFFSVLLLSLHVLLSLPPAF